MKSHFGMLLTLYLAFGVAPVVSAVDVPGGGKKKFDCYVGFKVEGTSNSQGITVKKNKVVKQLACDGSCTFEAQLCTGIAVPNCTPASVTGFEPTPPPLLPPELGGTEPTCGSVQTLTVALRGKRAGKQKFKLSGIGADGKKDKDSLTLLCKPNKLNTGCGSDQCDANADGGPDELVVTVLPSDWPGDFVKGSDLDNGWTGTSHNFPVPTDSKLKYCVTGCDGTEAKPVCTTTAVTGPGTENGTLFGPPLPLLAADTPVCVVNRFQSGPTGTANLLTGEASGLVNLFSDVYATEKTKVCPQCQGGTCDSGANQGRSCTIDGTVLVQESLASDKNFKLSKSCLPGGTPIGRLSIPLNLTTEEVGTPGLGGSKPCQEGKDHPKAVPIKDNDCGGGACASACLLGSKACTKMVPDPSNPTQQICQDIKGGLSQLCCDDNPTRPCFATQAGAPGIVRKGRRVVPVPAIPDATYPKVADGSVQVATFCETPTNANNVNQVTGLPGPGAVLFSTRMVFSKLP